MLSAAKMLLNAVLIAVLLALSHAAPLATNKNARELEAVLTSDNSLMMAPTTGTKSTKNHRALEMDDSSDVDEERRHQLSGDGDGGGEDGDRRRRQLHGVSHRHHGRVSRRRAYISHRSPVYYHSYPYYHGGFYRGGGDGD